MFSNASNFTNDVDLTFAIIIGISLFFLIGLTFLMIYFMIRYHHKRNPVAKDIHGHMGLEILWTVVPTILVLIMFYYGWAGYDNMRRPPKDAMHITATGRMWAWSFKYENGKVVDTLVVPKDKAVILDLRSEDVIHSLYIPAFRIKEDMVPGKENWMWFIGQQLGAYNILCAEYCGDRHSYMVSKVDVIEQEDFDRWYNDTAKAVLSGAEGGLTLMKQNACMSCHSIDGSQMVGPSFKGFIGRTTEVETESGIKKIVSDADYFIKSIEDPGSEVVKGFSKIMPEYKDKFTKEEYNQMLEYLKTLK
jgi:cytochrome c oxidase subunit II